VHRLVQPRRLVGDQAAARSDSGSLGLHALRDRQRHAAHGRHRLPELVGSSRAMERRSCFDLVVDPARQLAVVRQLALGPHGAALVLEVLAQHAGHAVERGADRGSLGARQPRQLHVEVARLELVEGGPRCGRRDAPCARRARTPGR
jgi:hypothetical protein